MFDSRNPLTLALSPQRRGDEEHQQLATTHLCQPALAGPDGNLILIDLNSGNAHRTLKNVVTDSGVLYASQFQGIEVHEIVPDIRLAVLDPRDAVLVPRDLGGGRGSRFWIVSEQL